MQPILLLWTLSIEDVGLIKIMVLSDIFFILFILDVHLMIMFMEFYKILVLSYTYIILVSALKEFTCAADQSIFSSLSPSSVTVNQ